MCAAQAFFALPVQMDWMQTFYKLIKYPCCHGGSFRRVGAASVGGELKILLVDGHALFRDGMQHILREFYEQVEILDAGNFTDALNTARDNPDIDIVLLDLNIPDSEGTSLVRLFSTSYPNIPVVVMSDYDQRDDIVVVMKNGAMGFVSKKSSEQDMIHALHLVLDGGIYLPPQLFQPAMGRVSLGKRSCRTNKYGLTVRQTEVLRHLAMGLTNKEIGLAIGLAAGTVKIHVAAIFLSLHVKKRIDAVRVAQRMGLLAAINSNS